MEHSIILHPAAAEQRTAAWYQARLGKITGSRVADMMDFTRNGTPSAKRKRYLAELIHERITGAPLDGPNTYWMRRGTAQESNARAEYALVTGAEVEEVGFIAHPRLAFAGSSPDGLVGLDGGIEIKVPDPINHILDRLEGGLPPQHYDQVQWNLACTEREWWDYVSYADTMPFPASISILRVSRDDQRIAEIEAAAVEFDQRVDAGVKLMLGG